MTSNTERINRFYEIGCDSNVQKKVNHLSHLDYYPTLMMIITTISIYIYHYYTGTYLA